MQPRYLINSSTLSSIFDDSRSLKELAAALAVFLKDQRWFAAKTEEIQSVDILDSVEIPGDVTTFELLLVTVVTDGGLSDCYAVPITSARQSGTDGSNAIIANLSNHDTAAASPVSLFECSDLPEFWRAVTTGLANRPLTTRHGREVRLSLTSNSQFTDAESLKASTFSLQGGEQSNSAVAIGNDFFLKLFRRPRVGHNPDAEIGIFLTDRTEFRNSPRVDATIDIVGPEGNRCLALISEQVSARADAWSYTLAKLQDYWIRLAALDDRPESPPQLDLLSGENAENRQTQIEQLTATLIGTFADEVTSLGYRTAELHAALSSSHDDPAFAPQPMTQESLNDLVAQIRAEVRSTCELIEQADLIEDSAADLPQKISLRANTLLDDLSAFDPAPSNVVSIRCHGDYHLGQVLRTDSDFVILDFEGEPDRPFDERRQKRCAMKDVAGMFRSLHYASCAATVGMLPTPAPSIANPNQWQTFWYENVKTAFLVGYELKAAGHPFFPTDRNAFQKLLDLFLIEKVLYELRYEINNRPDWVKIPLAGLNAVLGLT